jgi:predicted HD phosphohydrolase
VTTAVAPSPQFTALDRCDRCGAQAYVRVELSSGGELLFCAHHAREHGEKLQQVAAAIQDDTGRLTTTPSRTPSADR